MSIAELCAVTKRYPNGTLANEAVSFRIARGHVHAIVGENGAGKSTIMKMLYGLERPTSGDILLNGEPVTFADAQAAIAAGIGLVAQHLTGVPSFTVAENIVLGAEPRGRMFLDRRKAEREVAELSKSSGLAIDPAAILGDLSVGVRQRVEILKALYRRASLLLLDEPTAVLTPQETDDLFLSIRALVASGVTVVLITHKLNEVKAIADHITVLRDGRVAGDLPAAGLDEHAIAAMMVGRPVEPRKFRRVDKAGSVPLVSARDLTVVTPSGQTMLRNVSFDIAAGEIVGVAGVEGNGQDELARVMSGLASPAGGTATIEGMVFTGGGVRAARDAGIASVPEDRLHNGAAIHMSIEENAAATSYHRRPLSRFGILSQRMVRKHADALIARFGVRTSSARTPMAALSGGNMQKVIMGREIESRPRFLMVSQPTRGVDIGAAGSLREEIVALRDAGAAVLLISADLEEVMLLADRILVLFKGRIVAEYKADTADQRQIGLAMMGLAAAAPSDERRIAHA